MYDWGYGRKETEREREKERRTNPGELNQIEIYFSIVQRKVLTPMDVANAEDLLIQLDDPGCNRAVRGGDCSAPNFFELW
jgi:hypothetical protein